jgi:uncharacterized membrane protein
MNKKFLYGIGLFIVGLMALGLAINTIGLLIGNQHPLNSMIIIPLFVIIVITLGLFNKKRIKNWIASWNIRFPISVWLLILLPILAIAGAELVNATNNNLVLMIMLPLIVIVPVVCMFTKLIPSKYWGFAIWMMALSVLLHRALISQYLSGTDNIIELICSRITYNNEAWRTLTNWYSGYNTVLSITILPTMFSRIYSINVMWVFKVVFPVLLSFVPVIVYEIVKTQFKDKIALLSAFFIMAVYTFFTVTIMSDKQLIATILLAVFLLMLLNKEKWHWLAIIGLGICVSHYATAILFVGLFIVVALVMRKKSYIIISLVLAVITYAWYKLQGNGIVANQMSSISQSVGSVGSKDGMSNEIVRLFTQGTPYLPPVLIGLYVISQIAIIVGFIIAIFKKMLKLEYAVLSVIFLGLLGLELVLPRLSNIIGLERIYIYCMMILAPFVFVAIYKFTGWIFIAVLFISLFFLYNVGFINQLQGKPLSDSIALSPDRTDLPLFTAKELDGAKWLLDKQENIYSDNFGQYTFYYLGISDIETLRVSNNVLFFKLIDGKPEVVTLDGMTIGSYIFLRKVNIDNNELTLHIYKLNEEGTVQYSINDLGDFTQVINSSKIVYENSDCKILQTTVSYESKLQ